MLKIAVCDDEKRFAEILKEMLQTYLNNKRIDNVIDVYYSGKAILSHNVMLSEYDIFFLDINMKEIDGIEVAANVRPLCQDSFIVFVTAYVKYSLEGYKFDAIRYLVKGNENFEASLYECMDAIMQKKSYKEKTLTLDFRDETKKIHMDDIIYIESQLHNVLFHLDENKENVYILSSTLDKVEKMVKEHTFVRIHKSFLVNMKYVKNVKNSKVFLFDGKELPVPRPKYRTVKEAYIKYRGEM